jgi:hypothetical protein
MHAPARKAALHSFLTFIAQWGKDSSHGTRRMGNLAEVGQQPNQARSQIRRAHTCRARMSLMVSGSEWGCASTLDTTGMRGVTIRVDASASLQPHGQHAPTSCLALPGNSDLTGQGRIAI